MGGLHEFILHTAHWGDLGLRVSAVLNWPLLDQPGPVQSSLARFCSYQFGSVWLVGPLCIGVALMCLSQDPLGSVRSGSVRFCSCRFGSFRFDSPVCRFAGLPIRRFADSLVHRFASPPIYRFAGSPIRQSTDSPIRSRFVERARVDRFANLGQLADSNRFAELVCPIRIRVPL